MSEQRRTGAAGGGSGENPLRSDRGGTTIGSTVVQKIAGIEAQEVEKVQVDGGASAAVGGFLGSVTGAVTGSSSGTTGGEEVYEARGDARSEDRARSRRATLRRRPP